jgi:hypothetical protein
LAIPRLDNDTKYTVRPYRDGDEPQILELLDIAYLRKHSPDYWQWKYFENPNKKQIIVVAEYEEQIIGCSHAFHRELKIGESIHPMSFGGDSAVHPDYRKQGIYGKMRELRNELRIQPRCPLLYLARARHTIAMCANTVFKHPSV